ncbi:metallopeptidase family protein [Sphingomonas sp. 1P06PA]|uniref:metallopeptidase family protein n=1 Tax=Sphingomonas sp. 1P06PA TaxID=554121 RepID=UPI0039A53683
MADRHAPTAEELDALARTAIARLPDAFRALLDGVIVRVEDFAEEDVLAEMGIADAWELTGLYTGVAVGQKSIADSGALPDMIHLFRLPLLLEWIETGVGLEALITHVVVHEAGHHFGLSDGDMHALEDAAG